MKQRITISTASREQINKALRGERVPNADEVANPIRCDYCGNEFNQRRVTQKFCSTKCRVYYHRNMND